MPARLPLTVLAAALLGAVSAAVPTPAQASGPAAWGSAPVLVTAGTAPGQASARPSPLSADGRLVVFGTYDALDPEDDNAESDVYVRDTSTGSLRWVSVARDGGPADGHSSRPSISPDGRWVVWVSDSSDLVAGDTDGFNDVFLRDLLHGTTARVNVSSSGAQADAPFVDGVVPGGVPAGPSVADDGTVAFSSTASNLVPGDTNGVQDVFVHRLDGTTTRVSLTRDGGQLDADSDGYTVSRDAGCVAFTTRARGVPGDRDGDLDVYVHDLVAATTTQVSVGTAGQQGTGRAFDPSVSGDCRYVSFSSRADGLAGPTGTARPHVYVRDLVAGTVEEASLDPSGRAAGTDLRSSLSGDGRAVAFQSTAPLAEGVPADGRPRAYVRDLDAGRTQVLLARPDGQLPQTTWPVLSADGRHVSLSTPAALVAADTNTGGRGTDVYVVRATD